jgi:hypothetical protein
MSGKKGRAAMFQESLKEAQSTRKDWASKKKYLKGYLSILPVFQYQTGLITHKWFRDMWYNSDDPVKDIAYHFPDSGLSRVRIYTGAAVKVKDLMRTDLMTKPLGRFFAKSARECKGQTFVMFTVTGYKKQWIMTNEGMPDSLALVPRIIIPSAGTSKAIEIMPLDTFLKDMEDPEDI